MWHSLCLRELLREECLCTHARGLVELPVGGVAERRLRNDNVRRLRRVVQRLDGRANGRVVRGGTGGHGGGWSVLWGSRQAGRGTQRRARGRVGGGCEGRGASG